MECQWPHHNPQTPFVSPPLFCFLRSGHLTILPSLKCGSLSPTQKAISCKPPSLSFYLQATWDVELTSLIHHQGSQTGVPPLTLWDFRPHVQSLSVISPLLFSFQGFLFWWCLVIKQQCFEYTGKEAERWNDVPGLALMQWLQGVFEDSWKHTCLPRYRTIYVEVTWFASDAPHQLYWIGEEREGILLVLVLVWCSTKKGARATREWCIYCVGVMS